MWFDGMSAEEIRERLLKEGIFTKLLEDADLDQKILERAKQEPLEPEEANRLLESATKHMLLPFLSGIRPPENMNEIKMYSVQSSRNEVGDMILYLMAQAEISIFVTHFFRENYSEMYRSVQLEKVQQGLVFERIVEKHLEYANEYKWLEDFCDEHGNFIGNYKEYSILTNRALYFDFMIIDEQYVILAHRGYACDDVQIIECSSTAKIFLNIWNNLKPQKDQKGRPRGWQTRVTPHIRRKKI
jgi:hypothetical protein